MFNKLFKILKKTRSNFSKTLSTLIKKGINEEVLEDFEEQLLETDMGFRTVEEVLEVIRKNKSQNPLDSLSFPLRLRISDAKKGKASLKRERFGFSSNDEF